MGELHLAGGNKVFYMNESSKEFHICQQILLLISGDLVRTLMDNTMDSHVCESSVYDICVDGSTVIMPRFDGEDVLY